MKKYFKTQLKKSISLMLAVLMVLSCWVWVAPTEAEAADSPEEGYYYVQVFGNYHDWTDGTGVSDNTWEVTYKANNGTGTESTTTLSYVRSPQYANDPNIEGAALNNIIIAAGWVPGFPTKVYHDYNVSGCGADAFGVQPRKLYVGNVANTTSISGIEVATYGDQYSCNSDGGFDIFSVDPNGVYKPAPDSVVATVNPTSVTIPAIDSNQTVTLDASGKVYDQYGVRLLNETPDSYYLGDPGAGTPYPDTQADGAWVEGTSLKINENFQKNHVGVNVACLYATKTKSDGNKVTSGYGSCNINFTFPEYNMSINPNGQTGTTGAVMTMSDGKTQTTNWSTKGTYGSNGSAATWPTAVAEKTGYTFKGYWTNPQPTTGDASFNAYEADFATPITSTQFDEYKNNGGTVNGNYITVGDVTYYNAGQQWNPDARGIIGNKTYNGWWISTDIPVKFYDIDGAYLGTKTFKYGMNPAATEYPNPTEEYNAGAYNYSTFSGVWQEIGGTKVTEGSYTFGIDGLMELTLTPTYTNKQYKDKYAIKFINPSNGDELTGSAEYDYRYVLGAEIPGAAAVGKPNALTMDMGYSYEFAGWSAEAPASGNYHIITEDDTTFAPNSDWVVRDTATYYAVYRSTVKTYVVQFNYTDSTGTAVSKIENVKYGSTISTPSYVNATYAAGGMGYNLEGWKYINKSSQTVTLGANASLIFNSDNVQIANSNLADGVDEKAIVFTAAYDAGTPMPYTVTFKYKGANGEDLSITDQVYHNAFITQGTVDRLSVPETYDDGTALYTFANKWKVTEGAADKAEYTKDEFTSFSPTSHVTFEAIYGEGVPFYTVTYIDGSKTYSERILAGSNVPAWVVGEEVYEPSMADTDIGTYEFAGWYDEAQKDAEYKETNGTKYTTASIVNGDLTLYPQFKFSPFKFSIIFWNYDKSVQLAAGEYEYGQKFDDAFYRAQRAAQYRDPDEVYEYTFIGWDQPYNEDNLVCEGKDVDFVALYKPGYVYYNANWYKDINDYDNAEAEPLATTKHTYDSKVYAPSIDNMTAPEGKAFDGWYYKDADGAEQAFVRGMKITAEMNFYAKYKDAAVTYTVTTVVGGKETKYTVAAGDKANAIADPNAGYVDTTKHNEFNGWFTEDDKAFDIANTAITGDIKIIAKFTESAHDFSNKELIDAPTYYAKGKEAKWCSCDPTETREETEIAELSDTVKPTGTIYLGTQGSWSSTDEVGAAATDNDPVTLYANANTDLILIVNDTGDVDNAYNPSGIGKGIKMIRGFISKGVYSQGNQDVEMSEVVTIFEDDTETLNNAANYVIKLGAYEGLEDGETYVAYYYVQDKAGNVLNTNVRTAKFIYDNTAPEITIDGNSNADKVSGTPTYCATATVTDIEEGAIVTVNGEVVIVTEDKYVINTAGNYVITVTDKAGNSTSKKIIVAEDHDIYTVEVKSTCDEDGYLKETCLLCGYLKTNKTYKAPGHEWITSFVPATCDENGYNLKVCEVCGEEEKTEYINGVDGELIQAKLGHSYAKDDEKNIIYTVVTKATCSVEGKKIANCERCGAGTLTETIPVDADEHTYGAIKTLKPTCTEAGKTYKACKYCYKITDVEILEATGHEETKWVVTTAATCGKAGVETEKCKKCDAELATRDIPATGRHIVYEVERKAPTATEKGYIKYGCKTCDWTKTEEIATLKLYTVTFVNEDATTIAKFNDQVVGTTITEDYEYTYNKDTEDETTVKLVTPTKESDDTYNYTFAGWVDEKGNAVKLPFDVTGDIILKASFAKSTRIYTHKFMVPTKWTTTLADNDNNEEFATIMGAYGDTNKKPIATPTFVDADPDTDADLKALYTFEFMGWSTTGAAGDIVTDFTIEGDATFYAVFKAVPIEYNVIFYGEDMTQVLWTTKVDGGEKVTYAGEEPTKASDADKHYKFAGWLYNKAVIEPDYDDEINLAITETTRFYASFTGVGHNFKVVDKDEDENLLTWPATCTEQGQKTEKCVDCGYVKTTVIDALGHDFENGKIFEEDIELEDGTVIVAGSVQCSRCDEIKAPEAKVVTITFSDAGKTKTVELTEGEKFTYTASGKESTVAEDYTFKNWTDAKGNVVANTAEITVTAGKEDATYTANYEGATRKYLVSYHNWNHDLLSYEEVEYGADIPAQPEENPTKAFDKNYHYNFAGWSVNGAKEVEKVTGTVSGKTEIYAVYTAEAHDMTRVVSTEATCTTPSSTYKACANCEHKEVQSTAGVPVGHEPDEKGMDRKEPTIYEAGYEKFTCKYCGEFINNELKKLPSDTIRVTVYDNEGNLAKEGKARVKLIDKNTDAVYAEIGTDANGVATFIVPKGGSWRVVITGEKIPGGNGGDITTGDNTFGEPSEQEPEEDTGCSCSCHKDTFWGWIYRLFQKIIKFLTGSPKCCSNPDSRI